jgi:hypothetical protein
MDVDAFVVTFIAVVALAIVSSATALYVLLSGKWR